MSDNHYSEIKPLSEELKSKNETCEETGVTFAVGDKIETPSGRNGKVDGFRMIRGVVFADVKINLSASTIMRSYMLKGLVKVNE